MCYNNIRKVKFTLRGLVFMKKFYYIVGALVTATSLFLAVAVLLKKLRISLSIEGIDDEYIDENEIGDIDLSIEKDDEIFDESEFDALLEDNEPEIEIEITGQDEE